MKILLAVDGSKFEFVYVLIGSVASKVQSIASVPVLLVR